MDVDLVLLAMGFLGPVTNGMIEQLGLVLDARGNVATDENYMSSVDGVFAAGDMRAGNPWWCGQSQRVEKRLPR